MSAPTRLAFLFTVCTAAAAGRAGADPDDLTVPWEPVPVTGVVSGTLRPGNEDTVRFAALGDYGYSGVALRGISDMIHRWGPDFILALGDNNYGALDPNQDYDPVTPGIQNGWELNVGSYFGGFIKGRDDGKFPLQVSPVARFFPTVGNHDSAPDSSNGGTIEGYIDYFHENPGGTPRLPGDRGARHDATVSYYAFRRGMVDFFVLDGDVPLLPDIIAEQRTWLTERIQTSDARWKIAIFHQPPITSSTRGGNAWMAWPELAEVDAIFCGHDHIYERLNYSGTPMFINGSGGHPTLYPFRLEPDPNSIVRYNQSHSAMLVQATDLALTVECRAVLQPSGEESIVESVVIGHEGQIDNEDVYTFFSEAGETLVLTTETPAPLGAPPLDPRLELVAPDGAVVTTVANGGGDARNVRLEWTSGETGTWRVRVKAEGTGTGPYLLRLVTLSSRPAYAEWAAGLAAGTDGELDDADGDGQSNLLEFATQSDPADAESQWNGLSMSVAARVVTAQFELPSPLPPGVSWQLESSDSPGGPWTSAAWRPAAADWQCPPGHTIHVAAPSVGTRRVAIAMPVDDASPRRFFRMAVVRNG